jgi:quinoprotein glucose dehydrogenase
MADAARHHRSDEPAGPGAPTLGGPLATSGGLVFIGAAMDDYLRAFDAKTDAELWTGRLPATGNSTPTTYEWQGRQYVVIAAGGRGETGSPANDALVAFALPRPGESTPSPWVSWIDNPGGRFKLHAGMVAVALVAALVLLTSWRGRRRRRAQAAR